MQYSYKWLQSLSKTEKTPGELADMVMLKGFELEEIVDLAKNFDGIVVGKILALEKHPKADRLQLVKVDVAEEVLDVVCGAWNIKVGDLVPVATVGTIVPLNKMKVEAREVRGCVSQGMLCAEDELGLGKDHSGIMLLPDDMKIGMPLAQALGVDDYVIDLSILPNRAHDCLSYEGMAREICAMEGRKADFSSRGDTLQLAKESGNKLAIDIKDKNLCSRYIGAVLSGIKIGPSPVWMQARLIASGMEPINNVVDITNYVMLETGNPLHAFDFQKIKEPSEQRADIVVRRARTGETMELLDSKKLELNEDDLLITNGKTPLALAGIKGGKLSGIGNDTTEIVLEAADFNAYNIRMTRQRHSLLTESQARFEKSISPVLAEKAAWQAIELLVKYAGAKLEEVIDGGDGYDFKQQTVTLKVENATGLLGVQVKKEAIVNILTNLGFELENEGEAGLSFRLPYWRLDIEGPEDLIEEVGRIMGYDLIAEQPIVRPVELPLRNKNREFEWKLKDLMCGFGFDEMINYSFYGAEDAQLFVGTVQHLELANSLTKEHTLMRQSLLPGIVRNVAVNEKHFEQFSLFELGRTHYFQEKFPEERLKLAGSLAVVSLAESELFYQLKGKVQAFLKALAKNAVVSFQVSDLQTVTAAFHSSRTANILIDGKLLGMIGLASKNCLKYYGVKKTFAMFELDVMVLQAYMDQVYYYQSYGKYPKLKRDISMFVKYRTEVAEVEKIIKEEAGVLLVSSDLFDIYSDQANDRKSLAFHLEFGAQDRTLEGKEADEMFKNIVVALEKKIGAEVRKG